MAADEPRRLYREPDDKKLAGVCGGLADYFGLDPTVVRLGTVALALATGVGVVAYIIAALVVPQRPPSVPRRPAERAVLPAGSGPANGLIIALFVVALLVGVDRQWWLHGPIIGLMLVAVGVWLLVARDRGTLGLETDGVRGPWWPEVPGRDSAPQDEEIPPNSDTWSDGDATLAGETATDRDQIEWEGGDRSTADPSPESDQFAGPQGEVHPPIPPWGPPSPAVSQPVAAPAASRTALPAGTIALLLIGAGIMALLAVLDIVDAGLTEVLGGGLLVVGVALLVGAWRGRARILLAAGIPALVLLVLADVVNLPLKGGMGDRTFEVVSRSELDDSYELFAGNLVLDLTEAPLTATGPTPTVDVDLGLGDLEIRLPPEAEAEVDVRVGMGSAVVDGEEEEGGIRIRRTFRMDGEQGGGRVNLDLQIGLGEVRVVRG